MTNIDPENYRCPCCLNFIYDDYKCSNDHHICGNCFMKIKICPLCRDTNIDKSEIDNDVERKECKNTDCNLQIYHFDDEHELDCIHNDWYCKFCNNSMKNANFDSIINHYESHCANIFNIIKYENKIDVEKSGKKYDSQLKIGLSLLNIDDQYIIIIVPKSNTVNFIVFSTNVKYKLSNYKIKIGLRETFIHYKKMIDFYVPRDETISNNLIKFSITNMFIINRETKFYKRNGINFFESYVVDGEPGSAGNWTKEDYDEVYEKFTDVFKK